MSHATLRVTPLSCLLLLPALLLPACGGGGTPDPDAGPMGDAAVDMTMPTDGAGPDDGLDAGDDADTDAGGDAGPVDPGVITVTVQGAADLDFGDWTCGTPAPAARTVQVQNTGPSPAFFGIRRFAEYSEWFAYTGPAGGQLAPNATATFMVQPQLPPSEEVAPSSLSEALSAINVDPAFGSIGGLTVSPRVRRVGARFLANGEFDLGDVPVGTPGGATFSVQNLRSTPVTLDVVRELPAAITATIPGETAGQITLGASETRTGTFAYLANVAGVSRGRVYFTTAGPDCEPGAHREATLVARAVSGSLRVSTGELDLGVAGCDEQLEAQTLTVTNGGAGVMNWSAALAAGVSSPYVASPSSGSLAAGASQVITITPARAPAALTELPLALGDVLTITSDIPGEPARSVTLRHEVSGPVFRWGDARDVTLLANPGERSTTSFSLYNVGSTTGTATVAAAGSSVVTLTGAGNVTAAPGGGGVLTVAFEPTAGSLSGFSDLFVTSPGACALPLAADAPRIEGRPRTAGLETPLETVYLGTARCDQVLPAVTFPVTNTLDTALDVAVSTAGSFAVSMGGAPVPGSVAFAAGQTRTFSVIATDTSTFGTLRGALVLTPLGRTPLTVQLAMDRNGATLLATGEDLGQVSAGEDLVQLVQLENAGNVPALVGVEHLGTGFSSTVQVAPGTSTMSFVRRIPSGTFTDVVRFTPASDFVCTDTVDAEFPGQGVVLPSSVSSASLDFGSVDCNGAPAAARVVTLRNHSAAPLPFTASVLGSPVRFAVSPPSGTVAANGSVDLTVIPLAVGFTTYRTVRHELRIVTSSATHSLPLAENIRGNVFFAASSVDIPVTRVGETSPAAYLGIWGQGSSPYLSPLLSIVSNPGNELRLGSDAGFWTDYVQFTPASSGMRTFEVQLSPRPGVPLCAPLPDDITVTASAVSTAAPWVRPSTLRLPATRCGSTPPPTGFTVDNVGAASFTYTTTLASEPWVGVGPASATVAAGARQTVTVTPGAVPLGAYGPELLGNVANGFQYTHVEVIRVLADGTLSPVQVEIPVTGDGWYVTGTGSEGATNTHRVFVSLASTRLADGSLAYNFSPQTGPDCSLLGTRDEPSGRTFEFQCSANPAANSIRVGVSARTGSAPCVRAGDAFVYP